MFRFCNNKTNKEFIAAYFDSRKTLLEHNAPLNAEYLARYPYVPNPVLQWWSVLTNAWCMAQIDWSAMADDVTTTLQIDFGNKLADKLLTLIGPSANHIPPLVYFKDCYNIMTIHVRGGEDYDYGADAVYMETSARAIRFEECKHEYWDYLSKGCPVRSSVMYFWHAGYITDLQLRLLLEPIDIELILEDYSILDKVEFFDKFDTDKFFMLADRVDRVLRQQL